MASWVKYFLRVSIRRLPAKSTHRVSYLMVLLMLSLLYRLARTLICCLFCASWYFACVFLSIAYILYLFCSQSWLIATTVNPSYRLLTKINTLACSNRRSLTSCSRSYMARIQAVSCWILNSGSSVTVHTTQIRGFSPSFLFLAWISKCSFMSSPSSLLNVLTPIPTALLPCLHTLYSQAIATAPCCLSTPSDIYTYLN